MSKKQTSQQKDKTENLKKNSSQSSGSNKKIKELETLIDELKDQSVRALAEAENTRKRAEKEIADARKYSVSSITKDLIEVLENLYRATEHIDLNKADMPDSEKNLLEGIEMTKNSFIKVLENHGVIRIDPKPGEDFDHNFHQAISQEESKEFESGKITKVVQAGYKVGDRLTRPVMVVVSK